MEVVCKVRAAPGRLTIHVSGPGNLIISRGDNLITTLLNGRLEGHGFDIYEARWLQKSQGPSNSGQFENVLGITTEVPSSNRISSTCLAKTSRAG